MQNGVQDVRVVHNDQNTSRETYNQRAAGDVSHALGQCVRVAVDSQLADGRYDHGHTEEQCRDLIHVPAFFDNAEDQQNDGCQKNKQDCFFSAAKSRKGIQIRDVLSGLVEFVHRRKLRVLFNLGRV